MAPLPGTPDRPGVAGAVAAAAHDDRGLRDAGQLTGQLTGRVEARLAGETAGVSPPPAWFGKNSR